jgi:hypothetical protein
MQATLFRLLTCGLLLGGSAAAQSNSTAYVGYLISTFSDANPTVQWYLSKGNDPSTYSLLNKSQPVFKSTVGTKAVRDVFLATNNARNEWFMICTGEQRPRLRSVRRLTPEQISTSRPLAFHGTGLPAMAAAAW